MDLKKTKMATERINRPLITKMSHEDSDGPLSKTDNKPVKQSKGLKQGHDDQLPTDSKDLILASTERKSN